VDLRRYYFRFIFVFSKHRILHGQFFFKPYKRVIIGFWPPLFLQRNQLLIFIKVFLQSVTSFTLIKFKIFLCSLTFRIFIMKYILYLLQSQLFTLPGDFAFCKYERYYLSIKLEIVPLLFL
jgi:hypothetical protein